MKKYDFDKVIERKHTGCLKYDFAVQRGRPDDVLPFWVADMDFPVAEEISEALVKRCKHGIFGYSEVETGYFDALSAWYKNNFDWVVQEEWLTKTPGIVFALAAAVNAFTKPGEAVLIQRPVYYPFTEVIEENGRKLVNSPLKLEEEFYEMDFEDLEKKIVAENVKLMILCSPHNPVGRVWSEQELRAVGDICLKHGVIVISDEIHSDFVWGEHKHTVFANLGEVYAQNCIVCTAPSKTFNLAGLQVSNIFIPNPKLRQAFRKSVTAAGYSQLNSLGLVACEAAYKFGSVWLDEIRAYLYTNIIFVDAYLKTHLPKLRLLPPQGTYLLWIDFSQIGMTAREREQWLLHEAKLWLDDGYIFGEEGNDFERINVACPRSTLLQGLEQLKKAYDKILIP